MATFPAMGVPTAGNAVATMTLTGVSGRTTVCFVVLATAPPLNCARLASRAYSFLNIKQKLIGILLGTFRPPNLHLNHTRPPRQDTLILLPHTSRALAHPETLPLPPPLLLALHQSRLLSLILLLLPPNLLSPIISVVLLTAQPTSLKAQQTPHHHKPHHDARPDPPSSPKGPYRTDLTDAGEFVPLTSLHQCHPPKAPQPKAPQPAAQQPFPSLGSAGFVPSSSMLPAQHASGSAFIKD
ncbi:uncharacterized protein LOC123504405 [Portunus trituberculatus]|uniref:uncharacterized protein LOC123504405 n=1 Tax=Portunus trituberculatus TaxID=210409 RepID=UPI001E1CF53F|nr:uncharacterized protein LOC123504405 [Portunus trituberculatus]